MLQLYYNILPFQYNVWLCVCVCVCMHGCDRKCSYKPHLFFSSNLFISYFICWWCDGCFYVTLIPEVWPYETNEARGREWEKWRTYILKRRYSAWTPSFHGLLFFGRSFFFNNDFKHFWQWPATITICFTHNDSTSKLFSGRMNYIYMLAAHNLFINMSSIYCNWWWRYSDYGLIAILKMADFISSLGNDLIFN